MQNRRGLFAGMQSGRLSGFVPYKGTKDLPNAGRISRFIRNFVDMKVALGPFPRVGAPAPPTRRRAESPAAPAGADRPPRPEMFATGFVTEPWRTALPDEEELLAWMRRTARRYATALAGSAVVRSGDRFANRFFFVRPAGGAERYDKRHLFSIGGEDAHFVAGRRRVVVEYGGLRFLPLVCYDLRFPVWCRCRSDYDAILCVASWPAPRREVWRTLLRARAIENQCYVVGVNRTGDDPWNHYAGDSAVVDFKGTPLCEADASEGVFTARLDREALDRFRTKFPAWRDADDFLLR